MRVKQRIIRGFLVFSFVLFIAFLPSINAEEYYADISIDVDESGFVTIDGLTNYPGLLVENSPLYTYKKQSVWLLNITINEVFSDYFFTLNFPQGSSISKIESSGYSEIKQGLNVVGYGENTSLSIVVRYQINDVPVKNDLFNDNVFLILVFLIFVVFIFLVVSIVQNRRKNVSDSVEKDHVDGEYNFRGLTSRQKEIMKFLIDQNRPMTQAEIQKELGIPKAAVSRNIHSLELKGLIEIEKIGMSNLIRLKKQ